MSNSAGDTPRCPVCETRGGERPNQNVDYPFKCETPDCRVYSYRGEC